MMSLSLWLRVLYISSSTDSLSKIFLDTCLGALKAFEKRGPLHGFFILIAHFSMMKLQVVGLKRRRPQSVSVAVFFAVADGIPATDRFRGKKRGRPVRLRAGRFQEQGAEFPAPRSNCQDERFDPYFP